MAMTDLEWWENQRTNSPHLSCPYHNDKAKARWAVEIAPIVSAEIYNKVAGRKVLSDGVTYQTRILGWGATFAEALQDCRKKAEPYGIH